MAVSEKKKKSAKKSPAKSSVKNSELKPDRAKNSQIDIKSPSLYFNRELSWIEFNSRVLYEGMKPEVPPLEKLKYLAIFHNNLDEFFMVRVANILRQSRVGVAYFPADGLTPERQLALIHKKVVTLLEHADLFWNNTLQPTLKKLGVRVVEYRDLGLKAKRFLKHHFKNELYPLLTPQAIDPSRPFPVISSQSMNILVELSGDTDKPQYARIKTPSSISRFIFVPRNKDAKAFNAIGVKADPDDCYIIPIEALIEEHLDMLFPGFKVTGAIFFRVTRNTDLEIEEDEASDLLVAVKHLLDQRRFGEVVRLEVPSRSPKRLLSYLVKKFNLAPFQIYVRKGCLGFADMITLTELKKPKLKFNPYEAKPLPWLKISNIFDVIRKDDFFLYHPYDSFQAVLDFVDAAADDPQVLGIKQTLYRVGNDSPIVKALIRAKRQGKQVTAVVELKARFDESRNISWAQTLEEEGINVVYGLVGMKIHTKLCLVVRREGKSVSRYVHIGTGNYNPSTARLYTDLSFFTSDKSICADVTDLFNVMTGYAKPESFAELLVSPHNTRSELISKIEREISAHKEKGDGLLIFKMNQLTDEALIEALYKASMAGVKVRLQVRGTCTLKPGIEGVSDNIEVTSIIGRYLEHVRIYYFSNGGKNNGKDELYIGSADLMTRNLDRRVETLVPLRNKNIRTALMEGIIAPHLNDNVKAWVLKPDGSYTLRVPSEGEAIMNSQEYMMEYASSWVSLAERDGR